MHTQIVASLVAIAAIAYGFLREDDDSDTSFVVYFIHIAAFSALFGGQIQTTFVAAITMYKNMTRHSFGALQSKLFPKYFTAGIVLWSTVIVTHLLEHPFGSWNAGELLHMAVIGGGFLAVMGNALILSPANNAAMEDMFQVERDAGIVDDLNSKMDFSKVEKNEKWIQARREFGMLHGIGSLGNLMSILASIFHLYKLAACIDEI